MCAAPRNPESSAEDNRFSEIDAELTRMQQERVGLEFSDPKDLELAVLQALFKAERRKIADADPVGKALDARVRDLERELANASGDRKLERVLSDLRMARHERGTFRAASYLADDLRRIVSTVYAELGQIGDGRPGQRAQRRSIIRAELDVLLEAAGYVSLEAYEELVATRKAISDEVYEVRRGVKR